MNRSDGIYMRKEIHATDWNGGKGKIANHLIDKTTRAALFDYWLAGIANIPSAQLINAAVDKKEEDRAFEWLLNRINVNMSKAGSRAVIFCDEGKNFDGLLRRMRKFNPISSQRGVWGDGAAFRNITLDRVLEDIIYRDSKRSILIQAADCCGYALLRHENPIESKTKFGLDQSFMILESIMVKAANGRDKLGIIR